MTAQKARITAALREIGAAWATSASKHVSPNDPLEDQIAGRATYHVHPDRSEPRTEHIQRFDSLRELEAWIREQRPLRRRPGAKRDGRRTNVYLSPEQKRQLRQRHGSVQAGVEVAVKKALESNV